MFFMKKSRLIVVLTVIILGCFTGNVFSQPRCFRIGLNGGSPNDMFLNKFTIVRMFNPKQYQVPSDSSGYPLSVPCINLETSDTIREINYLVSNSPTAVLEEDTIYVLRWDGDGEFKMTSWYHRQYLNPACGDPDPNANCNQFMRSDSGRMLFIPKYKESDLTFRNISFVLIRSNPDDPVRNMRLYKKSQEHLYEVEGERFHPQYLEKIEPFYMIRFMGAFNTNRESGEFLSWDEHTPKHYWNQASGPHNAGLAYEWAVELCNRTKKHIWFNTPHAADDYSIRKMAEIVRDQLDPNLMVYLEYSNETWNGAPPYRQQLDYVMEHGGWVDGHVKLSKNVFRIWHEVFGKDKERVKRTMATQSIKDSYVGRRRMELCGEENFDVYAPTYYWNGENKGEWDENTTVDEMIQSMYDNIRGGHWYVTKKSLADQGVLFGKEVYCYEGGMGGDPGDTTCPSPFGWPCHPYWENFQKVQTDPRLLDVQDELFDSLTSMGIKGGNELSLTGGWQYHNVTKAINFWGLIPTVYHAPEPYPKYMGVVRKSQDCDQLMFASDTIGAGLAIRLDGNDDYMDCPNTFKPDDAADNYTIECWVRPEMLGYDQTIFSMNKNNGTTGNNLVLKDNNRFNWIVKNNAGNTVMNISGSIAVKDKYYHILLRKNGNNYKMYINGVEKGSAQGNITGDCSRDRLVFGADISGGSPSDYFRGRVDEIRIWNKAITNLSTIRNWMCRKINGSHPDYSNLQEYYRFDSVNVNGVVFDSKNNNNAILYNVGFTHFSNYKKSAAPIGDDSRQIYPPNWNNISLTYYASHGDRMTVTNLGSGSPEGVHVYYVGQEPNNVEKPDGYYNMGSYYFGVFTANGNDPEYKVIYNYQGNPDVGVEADNRLIKRDNNEDLYNWRSTGAALDINANTLFTRPGQEAYHAEYMLGLRRSKVSNLSGAGYALRFDGNDSSYAKLLRYFRPDEEYTVSFWFRTDDAGGDFVWFDDYQDSEWSDHTHIGTFAGSCLEYHTGGASGVTARSAYDIDMTQWNHAAVVKKNGKINAYLNGRITKIKDFEVGVHESGEKRDRGYVRVHLGPGFKGDIDEFRVWDMALDTTTIREWMCRTITNEHPYENEHLVTYFKFDEGEGLQLENMRGAGNMELINDVEWVYSAAPIGDTSAYNIGGATLSLTHPDGDFVSLTMDEEFSQRNDVPSFEGLHLYRIDNAPAHSVYPSQVQSLDSTRYWGVYIDARSKHRKLRGPHRYDLTYYYEGNPNVVEENNIRLLNRDNNADDTWNYNATAPDIGQKTLDITAETVYDTAKERYNSRPNEVILAGISPTAISIDTTPPERPGAIIGKNPVCAGETELVYQINPVERAKFYIWTLPNGMSGTSDADTILVNVSPDASGFIGNISVTAANRYGESPPGELSITVEATPSLSVEITGTAEVCAGEQDVSYSIPSVTGALSYSWEVTGDASYTGSGTNIFVDFGNENSTVSVFGNFSCGTTIINSKPVTVNVSPNATLEVTDDRACRGYKDEVLVKIEDSQLGVAYRLYKNNGTSPVGEVAYGNGSQLSVPIQVTDLSAGENMITVKASVEGCGEVELEDQSSQIIDIPPSPGMPFHLEENPVCVGDTAVLVIDNSPSGVKFTTMVDYDWTIDSKPPYDIIPAVTSEGGETKMYLRPAPWNNQMSGAGIALGPNRISLRGVIGNCPTVFFDSVLDLTVPHDPRFAYWKDFDYWDVPIPMEDTIDFVLDKYSFCSNETVTIEVQNAQAGIRYAAFLVEEKIKVMTLSDTMECMTDRTSVFLTIPPNTLTGDLEQNIKVEAIGPTCTAFLLRGRKVDVYQAPNLTLPVSDYTVCGDIGAEITLQGSEENVTYTARLLGTGFTGSQTGTGNNLVFTVPNGELAAETNRLVIDASTANCASKTLEDTATIHNVASLDDDLSTAGNYSELCIGVAGKATVYNPQPGVNYAAFDGTRSLGDTVTGNGDSIQVTLSPDTLNKYYVGSDFTVTIKAFTGNCLVDLINTVTFNLKDSPAYPLDGSLIMWHNNVICPYEGDPVWVAIKDNDEYEDIPDLTIQGTVEGRRVGNPTPVHPGGGYWDSIYIEYPRHELINDSSMYLGFVALLPGCPPQKIKNLSGNSFDEQPTYIVPPYHLNKTIVNDTICNTEGETAKITILDPEGVGTGKYTYRLYDPVKELAMSHENSTAWWNTRDGNLHLPVEYPDSLSLGENLLDVQVRYRNGCEGWVNMNTRAVIYVSVPPIDTIPVIGNSQCAGDGHIDVEQTETDVYYQAYMGSTGVSDKIRGNGGSIMLNIAGSWLAQGTNEISVQATRAGCETSPLDERAIIEIIANAPSEVPGPVTGTDSVCSGETSVQYSVPNSTEASSYTWFLPAGATTTSASNNALVDFSLNGGEIKVIANNICGSSDTSASFNVTVIPTASGGEITGGISGCIVDNATLMLTDYAGEVQRWQYSEFQGVWNEIFETGSELTVSNVPRTRIYRAIVKSGENCGEEYSLADTIKVLTPHLDTVTRQDESGLDTKDGQIVIFAQGGAENYQYSIDDGTNWFDTSNIINNLAPGPYNIRVRNADNSCEIIYPYNPVIIQSFSCPFDITAVDYHEESACGSADGRISISVNDSFTYRYSITGGASYVNDSIFTGLDTGTYYIQVQAVEPACSKDYPVPVVLNPKEFPRLDAITKSDASSCETTDGSIQITASGGSGNYQYTFNGGTDWVSGNTGNDLSPGYYVTGVRYDDTTCQVLNDTSVEITSPGSPVIDDVVVSGNTHCVNPTGSMEVLASGGDGKYVFSIDSVQWDTLGIYTGLSSGFYDVYVKNRDGSCLVYKSGIKVDSAVYPVAEAGSGFVVCEGAEVILSATGGDTYQWNNSIQQGVAFNPVKTLTYRVTVIDTITGCSDTDSIIISVTPGPEILLTGDTLFCPENLSAKELNVQSGFETYRWEYEGNVQTGATVYPVSDTGLYSVTVTNASGCSSTDEVRVGYYSNLPVARINDDADTLFACDNEDVMLYANTSMNAVQYLWDNTPGDTAIVKKLLASQTVSGTHFLTVTSPDGCIDRDSIYLDILPVSEPEFDEYDTSVWAGQSGMIYSVYMSTGYAYRWTVTEEGEIVGDSIYPYIVVNWFDQPQSKVAIITVHAERIYQVTECAAQSELVVTIVKPDPLVISKHVEQLNCDGTGNGKITVTSSGGYGDIQYHWKKNGAAMSVTDSVIDNLTAGEYSLMVSSENLDTVFDTTMIRLPNHLILTVTVEEDIECPGDTAVISATSSGGSGVRHYSWKNGFTDSTLVTTLPGLYTVMVRDEADCRDTARAEINEPDTMHVTVSYKKLPECPLSSDGGLGVEVEGGFPFYVIKWSTGAYSARIEGLDAGTYFYRVEDQNQCEISDTIHLMNKRDNCFTVPTAFSPNADGINDEWVINGLYEYYPEANVEVFNRWGDMVYNSESNGHRYWNGTYLGKPLPVDSYHFIIRLGNRENPIMGQVTILR